MHWAAVRNLGAWGKVVGKTPNGEPVVRTGVDRLVLRRGERRFWKAAQCGRCGAETAMPDLDAHQRTCEGVVTPTPSRPRPSPPPIRPAVRSRSVKSRPIPSAPAGHSTGMGPPSRSTVNAGGAAQVGPTSDAPPAPPPVVAPPVLHRAPSPRTEPSVPRARRRVPSWSVAPLVVAAAAVLIASVLAMDPPSKSGPAVPTSRQTSPPEQPPSTPAATDVVLPQNEQIALQEKSFATARERVTKGLVQKLDQATVTSVDRLEFDPTGPTVIAQVTSPVTAESSLRDTAWAVTEHLLVFWDPAMMVRVPSAVPAFRLQLNTVRIECPAGLMLQLGYGGSRAQWDATCVSAR